MKKFLLILLLVATASVQTFAQCAMCRSTLENNFSNGDPGIASAINTGILYLLALPYLVAMVIGYLWYKSTRNGEKKLSKRVA